MTLPFWKRKALAAMSAREWESLCDGCGKCCAIKLEDEDTGDVFYTNVVCRLLDLDTCRCRDYGNRARQVPDCLQLSAQNLKADLLPATCAYRLLVEGRDLPEWHPLVAGSGGSVHTTGHSVLGKVVSETEVDDLEHHLIIDEDF